MAHADPCSNVAEMFKTPGKLRGKTPRTARKQNNGDARVVCPLWPSLRGDADLTRRSLFQISFLERLEGTPTPSCSSSTALIRRAPIPTSLRSHPRAGNRPSGPCPHRGARLKPKPLSRTLGTTGASLSPRMSSIISNRPLLSGKALLSAVPRPATERRVPPRREFSGPLQLLSQRQRKTKRRRSCLTPPNGSHPRKLPAPEI